MGQDALQLAGWNCRAPRRCARNGQAIQFAQQKALKGRGLSPNFT